MLSLARERSITIMKKTNVKDIAAGPQAPAASNADLAAALAKIAELESKISAPVSASVTAEQISGIVAQALANQPRGVTADQVSGAIRSALTEQEQKLAAALARPEQVVRAEAFLGSMLGTKEGKEKLAELAYGAGSLEMARQLEGQPLEDGWVSDVKKAACTNVKAWHIPLYAAGAGALFVIAKRMGWTDQLAEFLGID